VAVAGAEAPGDLEGGGEAHGLGPPHAAHRRHLGHVAPRHLLEGAELGEQRMSHVESAHALDARAELYREELPVGERRGAFVIQALPRALLRRPLTNLRRVLHAAKYDAPPACVNVQLRRRHPVSLPAR
jgi:hypothetical protein